MFGPTTVGINEIAQAIYAKPDVTAPGAEGQFTLIWDDGDGNLAIEDLLVVAAGAAESEFPLVPAEGPDEPVLGPCAAWVTAEAVAECAGVELGTDNEDLLAQVAVEASMFLYRASIYQYSGQCSHEARPCASRRGCGHDWDYYDREFGYQCGCGVLDTITLPVYPVTSITEVVIDGTAIDPNTYRLERDWQTLLRTRAADEPDVRLYWPSCQNMDENDLTLPGTFVVRYLAGVNPPPSGVRAAAELGAELLRACPGGGGAQGECRLPQGVTQLNRQGVSMSFAGFRSFAFDSGQRAWNTGLRAVDMFLSAENPTNRRMPSAFFSPDAPYYAEQIGTTF